MAGWIKIHRQLMRWEWYSDSQCVHLFLHLLLSANHKDGSWRGIPVMRGQHLTSRRTLAKTLNMSERAVRTRLERLENTGVIETLAAHKNTIITICNYTAFQESSNYDRPTSDPQNDNETTHKTTHKNNLKVIDINRENGNVEIKTTHKTTTKRPTKRPLTRSKEVKNKNHIVESVVDTLNRVTGSHYKPTTAKTQTLIKARLKEGFDLEDFKTVIEVKSREWLSTEMEKFLRPETLFGPKFESYLNQQQKQRQQATSVESTPTDIAERIKLTMSQVGRVQ